MKKLLFIPLLCISLSTLVACSASDADSSNETTLNKSISKEAPVQTEKERTNEQIELLKSVRETKIAKLLYLLEEPTAWQDAKEAGNGGLKFITRKISLKEFDITYRNEGLQYVEDQLSDMNGHYYFNIPISITNHSEYAANYRFYDFKVNGISTKSSNFSIYLIPEDSYSINEDSDELAVFHPIKNGLNFDEITFKIGLTHVPKASKENQYGFELPKDIIPHLTVFNVHEYYPDIDDY